VGLASWAPGETARRDADGITAIGMHAGADGLRLDPCVFRPFVGYERGRLSEGWLWNGREAHPLALEAEGAMAGRAVSDDWIASAYPEADLVRLESSGGRRIDMTCRYPRGLAWVGDSLLVSTVDREVLLFPGLRTHLDERDS
jgi:hypothetical protein